MSNPENPTPPSDPSDQVDPPVPELTPEQKAILKDVQVFLIENGLKEIKMTSQQDSDKRGDQQDLIMQELNDGGNFDPMYFGLMNQKLNDQAAEGELVDIVQAVGLIDGDVTVDALMMLHNREGLTGDDGTEPDLLGVIIRIDDMALEFRVNYQLKKIGSKQYLEVFVSSENWPIMNDRLTPPLDIEQYYKQDHIELEGGIIEEWEPLETYKALLEDYGLREAMEAYYVDNDWNKTQMNSSLIDFSKLQRKIQMIIESYKGSK